MQWSSLVISDVHKAPKKDKFRKLWIKNERSLTSVLTSAIFFQSALIKTRVNQYVYPLMSPLDLHFRFIKILVPSKDPIQHHYQNLHHHKKKNKNKNNNKKKNSIKLPVTSKD